MEKNRGRLDKKKARTVYSYRRLNNNQLSGKTGYLKTGTVALGDSGQNRDAIAAGYTDNLALGIWMGAIEDGAPVTDANGGMMWGAGAPTTLWRDILNEVG